jgi:phosphate transport system substrate-binding protein
MLRKDHLVRNGLLMVLAVFTTGCGESDRRVVIQNKGSDSLVNVAQAWAEAYLEVDNTAIVAVSGGGSGTGIASLINGTVDIANTSRAMTPKEIDLAKKSGHDPMQHVVGHDALAVFVHKDNPLGPVTLAQIAEIYGENGTTTKWSDLEVEVPGCKDQTIVLVGRQNNSGTYAYFSEAVLGKDREPKLGTLDLHGSKDVVELVGNTPCAIGYSGVAYATEHARMLCLAFEEGVPCVEPSVASATDGSYPISRPLFMYTNGQPQGPIGSFLNWVLSDAGQCILLNKGYAPVRDVSCTG